MNSTTEILDERQSTYGDFETCAKRAQEMKHYLRKESDNLTHRQREALEMIAVKIARILNGGQYHQDNWQDISGYALLGGEIYTPQLSDNAKSLPEPLTHSIYPESHRDKYSVWRLDLEFETQEDAVTVIESLTGKSVGVIEINNGQTV